MALTKSILTKLKDKVASNVMPTADDIMATFLDAVGALDSIVDYVGKKVAVVEGAISELDAEKESLLAEGDKAIKYAKNLRKVLEV